LLHPMNRDTVPGIFFPLIHILKAALLSLSSQSDDRSVAGRSPNSGPSLGRVSSGDYGPAD
jgi:hypothetical protein